MINLSYKFKLKGTSVKTKQNYDYIRQAELTQE